MPNPSLLSLRKILLLVFIPLGCFFQTITLNAVDRFPRPEFETGYQAPVTTTPASPFVLESIIDIGLLVIFLGLGAWFTIWHRSRRAIFVITLLALAYFGFWRVGCVCPIGSVQNVTLAAFNPLQPLPIVVLLFFLLPVLFALFAGRSFCSGVCPLGAIQDVVVVKPLKVPSKVRAVLSIIPYLYLGVAVLMVATGGGFLICQYDPFVGFFRLDGPLLMISLGLIFLLVGMFIARPYCQFFCPYGIILGWLSKLSWKHIKITPTACIGCKQCEDSCPFEAILPPKPAPKTQAERQSQRKKLLTLLALWPVWMIIGGLVGYFMTPLLLDLRTAISGFEPAPTEHMELGATLLGIFIGFMAGALSLKEPMRKPTDDYTIDPVTCLSCGRCFDDCPKESELRRCELNKNGGTHNG